MNTQRGYIRTCCIYIEGFEKRAVEFQVNDFGESSENIVYLSRVSSLELLILTLIVTECVNGTMFLALILHSSYFLQSFSSFKIVIQSQFLENSYSLVIKSFLNML